MAGRGLPRQHTVDTGLLTSDKLTRHYHDGASRRSESAGVCVLAEVPTVLLITARLVLDVELKHEIDFAVWFRGKYN